MNLNLDINKISSQMNPLFTYLQKKRENQKFAKSIEIGGTFFLISFFVLFAIKPTLLTISSLLGDINSKEVLSKQLKGKINDVIAAQDLFSQAEERYSLVEASLPNTPRFYHANSQILGATSKNQISLEKLTYSVKEDNYFSINLTTTTSFTSAMSAISDLLQNRRLIDLDNVSFSINEDNPGQVVNINLPLKIYYWQDDVKK